MTMSGGWSQSKRFLLERWPEGNGSEMEFRLVVRGAVPPEKRGTVSDKQRIRREFHPQIRSLYQQHPALEHLFRMPWKGHARIADVANQFSRNGFKFLPMVREELDVACALDVLMLLRQPPHHQVFSGTGNTGDLDNRVKVLIDGLTMPKQLGDLGGDVSGADDEPFFCLLEDDKLIHAFNVTTDLLLAPPEPSEAWSDVVAVVHVRVKSRSGRGLSIYDV
jgi:hypothetical protein